MSTVPAILAARARRWRHARHGYVPAARRVWVAVGVVLALLLAGSPAALAAAGPGSSHRAAGRALGAAAALPQDLSSTLPN